MSPNLHSPQEVLAHPLFPTESCLLVSIYHTAFFLLNVMNILWESPDLHTHVWDMHVK